MIKYIPGNRAGTVGFRPVFGAGSDHCGPAVKELPGLTAKEDAA